MLFPDTPRVSYSRNPLEQVICQLRFPTVLRVSAQSPVEFQEEIRAEFPILRRRSELAWELPTELAKLLPAELLSGPSDAVYDFLSADESLTLSLSKDFLALTSRRYERWESFRANMQGCLHALEANYQPSFLIRIGLRYRNIVDRSALGLPLDTPWSELLAPHVLGFLQSETIAPRVKSLAHESLISEDSSKQVRVRHGLVHRKDSHEACFLVDADFFTEERIECGRSLEVLDGFNLDAGRLFRWCIQDRLHFALGPIPLGRPDTGDRTADDNLD